jgi:hypothetical protein
VKFFELVPLNACKKTAVYATSEAAMTAFAKGWAGVMIYHRPHHQALEGHSRRSHRAELP